MRALSLVLSVAVCLFLFAAGTRGETIQNHDFEAGDLTGWDGSADQLTVSASTNETFNRSYAASISGTYAADSWITNSISQTISAMAGDDLDLLAFVYWKSQIGTGPGASGRVEATLSGTFGTNSQVWTEPSDGWHIVELSESLFGIANTGFETGDQTGWTAGCDDLSTAVQTNFVDGGYYALEMSGSWTGWSWNQVYQLVTLESGEVFDASARIYLDDFEASAGWAVAGIKIEYDGDATKGQAESVVGTASVEDSWEDLSFTWTCSNSGVYVYRCMVLGDVTPGVATSAVYFDDVELLKQGSGAGGTSDVTFAVSYLGYSGGAAYTNSAEVFLDTVLLSGSSAGLEPATNVFMTVQSEAAAVGTNPLVDIKPLLYPPLNAEGYPEGEELGTNFAAYVEVMVPGWKFQFMTNDVLRTVTNIVRTYQLGDEPGFYEFDWYGYVGKMPHKERGEALEIDTNSPYFIIGTPDDSGAEFGEGPFDATHRYVVGTSLTNFPRRMTTDASGGWPSVLEIVFDENFTHFTNSLWNKHFILATVPTNGAASQEKAVKVELYATETGGASSNRVSSTSQELHLGWATKDQVYGKVDYPNCTYQDHNEVSLRAPWLYNLLDDGTGWFMQQRPRGSATIEPIDLYTYENGSWLPAVYEEYLYGWDAAGSGVASLFDDDSEDRVKGNVSYHIGFKVGHQYGTNELGQPMFPEVINIRGNGYFRMTDYEGVMAGSFRPVAADVFALYQLENEDAPLMPKAYTRVVPRTTPVNEPDNSYAQAFLSVQSKSNNWFTSAVKMDMHFTPDEAFSNGCYFVLDAHTYANQAVVLTNHGPLAAFAQVSMHWRGATEDIEDTDFSDLGVDGGEEGHDIDAVLLKKADGEWITHQVLNPPTNIYLRTLGTFEAGDAVYLMQQDRAPGSYGFATESPYSKASSFEITMLEDGGHDLTLDIYEQNTISEINDNVDIVANFQEDFAQGDEVHYRYQYRTTFAPGVYIINPNETSGHENWVSNNIYEIEFYVTDGDDKETHANLYYGNGLDSDWTKINTGGFVPVDTVTDRASYEWNVSAVPAGAYYIMVEAQRTNGGKFGFDVSNTRLMIGDTYAFEYTGPTNGTRDEYWMGAGSVDVSSHDLLRFWLSGTYGCDDLQVEVSDALGVTNALAVTNFIDRIVSFPQRVDVLWTNFTSIDPTQINYIGFSSSALSNDNVAAKMRSLATPILAHSTVSGSPQVDLEGMPLFNPGDTVTNLVTIQNISGTPVTGLTIQLVQEYGENRFWTDTSHTPAIQSAKMRPGDRLCGIFEERYTNQSISAGSAIVLTNIYEVPFGKRVDHERHVHEYPRDWYFNRNYEGHAQVHLVMREQDGDNIYDMDQAGYYVMDNDFDIDDDGLPDSFEIENSTSGTYTGLESHVDGDGDTFDNLQEFIAGTVPTNDASYPAVAGIIHTNDGPAEIWFNSITGRQYDVSWCNDLMAPVWQSLNTNISGDNGLQVIMDGDVSGATNRFYRLGIEFEQTAWPQ